MSSGDQLGGALPTLYARVPINLDRNFPTSKDLFRTLPGAARTVYQAIHLLALAAAREGREITVTDRELAKLCGICRRCVQKGLKQLQDAKLISRLRQHGGRIISFLVNFAGRVAEKVVLKSGRKSDPAATKQPDAEQGPGPTLPREKSEPTTAQSPDPAPDPGPPISKEEREAIFREAGIPAPHVPVGPSLSAAVPKRLSPEEAERARQEKKRVFEEWKAARARAGEAQASGQDQPAAPPAPSGSDESARE